MKVLSSRESDINLFFKVRAKFFTEEWFRWKEEELCFAERLQLKQPHRHVLRLDEVNT
jgi:hypothetical protein